jgi:2-oxoglutarate ferredoxin oxidoreductase subunit beta
MRGLGFTMVEVLSPCPTNWGLDPIQAITWLEDQMIPIFPLGEIKDTLLREQGECVERRL